MSNLTAAKKLVSMILVMSLVFTFSFAFPQNVKAVNICEPKIKGSFVQSWMCNSWDNARWQQELTTMKEAGLEYLIIADVAEKAKDADGGKWTLYYPSVLPELSGTNRQAYYGDVITKALSNCQTQGIKVFVGMGGFGDWWSSGAGSKFTSFSTVSAKIVNEIYDMYKSLYPTTFYGWYFVPEIYNNNFNIIPNKNNLAAGMNTVIAKINQKSTSMPLMLSPYFTQYYASASLSSTQTFWTSLFSLVNFRQNDIFCPQDAVGAGWVTMANLTNVHQMYKTVVDGSNKGVKLWANCENFTQPQSGGALAPPATENTQYITSTLDRFVTQLNTAAQYAENIISFSYNHYYSPHCVRSVFYDTYYKYYKTGVLENQAPTATQIRSEVVNTNQLKLSWNEFYDNIGIAYYRVFKNGTRVARLDSQGTTLAREYTDTSFSTSGQTTYEIQAVDGAGNASVKAKLIVQGAAPNNYVDLSANSKYKRVCDFENVPAGIMPSVNDTVGYFSDCTGNNQTDFVLQTADSIGYLQSRGLKFSVKTTSTANVWVSNRIYPPSYNATAAKGADAFYFWIDTSTMTGTNQFSHQLYFSEFDAVANETTVWALTATPTVYMENQSGGYKQITGGSSGITYPSKYKGFVKVPFSSFAPTWGTTDTNAKVGLDNINYILLGFNSMSSWQGSNVSFDNFGFTGPLFTETANAKNTCDYQNIPLNTMPGINDSLGYFDATANNGVNFKLEVTEKGVGNSKALEYSVPVGATANTWVSCKTTSVGFNQSDGLNTNQISFWIDTTRLNTNAKFEHQFYFTESDTSANEVTTWGLKTNFLYFLKEDNETSYQMASSNGNLIYPVNFKGYVTVPLAYFEPKFSTPNANGQMGLNSINHVWVAFNSWVAWKGSGVSFDNFSFASGYTNEVIPTQYTYA